MKLSDDDIRAIHASRKKAKDIAEEYKIGISSVYAIKRGTFRPRLKLPPCIQARNRKFTKEILKANANIKERLDLPTDHPHNILARKVREFSHKAS